MRGAARMRDAHAKNKKERIRRKRVCRGREDGLNFGEASVTRCWGLPAELGRCVAYAESGDV
jgi:hypothetical protein